MKQTRRGMTLLEFLIYLLLFSSITTVSAYWVHVAWQFVTGYGSRCTMRITLHMAHDLLVRDIHGASSKRETWKKIEPDIVIWHIGRKDVGWQYKKGQLLRIEGNFDESTNRWHKKVQSVVAQSIAEVQFHIYGQDAIEYVGFEFKADGKNKQYIVANTVMVRKRKLA